MKDNLAWFAELEEESSDRVKLDFALSLERNIVEQGLKKKDLAALLGTSAAWITKVLRGDANLTIETMSQLADALNCELYLHLAPKNAAVRWFEVYKTIATPREHSDVPAWSLKRNAWDGKRIPFAA